MDIGTAKPSRASRAAVTHHLIDIADPAEPYSAGSFRRDALAAIEDIRRRERIPLLVGGTLLYLRALRDGLAALPSADASVRRTLDAEAAATGWPALHEQLAKIDPVTASRLAPGDRQRIQRALEVHRLTGQTLSELLSHDGSQKPFDITTIALIPDDRVELSRRIEERFDAMVKEGLTAEVEALRSRGDLTAATPSMRAVGYRQIWAYLDGEIDWPEARRSAIAATRQLAKRQLTWLRSEQALCRLPAHEAGLAERIGALMEGLIRRP
jgi:tRNA dimethylallyltransferase